MLPIKDVVNPQGLFFPKERHCALCLNDTCNPGQLYGRLIWQLGCVNACPVHNIRLIPSECGAPINKHLHQFARKTLPGVCPKCGSINYRCRKEAEVNASDDEVWKAQQVAELISYFPKASQLFSLNKIMDGLTFVISAVAEGKPAILGRRAGINKSTLWGWMHGHFSPNLGSLLELCQAAGFSLVSVMKGNPIECPTPYKLKKIAKVIWKPTKEEREHAFVQALTSNPPICFTTVARSLQISRKVLRKQFPVESTHVIDRYQQYLSEQKIAKRKAAEELVMNVIEELHAKGKPVTQRNFQQLSGKMLMPRSLLYRIFDDLRNEQDKTAIKPPV